MMRHLTMSSKSQFLQTLEAYPALADCVTFDRVFLLFQLIKERISTVQISQCTGPPLALPGQIHHFLAAALSLDDSVMVLFWASFRESLTS